MMPSAHNAPKRFTFVLDEAVRILVVDDDPIQREFSQVYLASPKAVVETVESAEAAAALLQEQRYDAALIDVDLGGMDGIALVRRLRTDPRYDCTGAR